MMKRILDFFAQRLLAFRNLDGWVMVFLGLLMYASRFPMPKDWFVNLPMVLTVLQVAGLMFMLSGLQIFLSIMMWPNVDLDDLLERAEQGNVASGVAAAGLMVYNGMSLIAMVIWLIYGTGARLGA